MAKRLNYQVSFTADTSSLQTSVNQAVQSLMKLGSSSQLQISKELQSASGAALDLAMNLQKAFNQDTGKLDLVTFNNELKKSGMTLGDYADKLSSIGPDGEKAFMDLASAITKAELPLKRSNALLDELWVTMKNTMRWQLTSSALHGFMGAVQTAYGYTKDLNESLNSIQIVTSKSGEDMANFAEQANKAARALSTTTTDYTDASLIYYQQGLSDEQVEARTNTTIKLANVARESAQEASEQLTAIWNNFAKGGENLEYYVDVMAALGATTASSTQEISDGIQKFAAVADTVGLSYEYAASALATITATTRESADVVGTALRTLFARIQGLMQDGEADDGTTLNKYSKALAEVGIQIKDTEGNLKQMDTILNELGNTWGTLTKSQQMALAQTVAGVRQYTQLIALMDNWSFFQENLVTAMQSEGTLEKQAKIYAESWEAARNRVRAASEDIYDSLINEDFFIGVDNLVAPLLDRISDVIDALGGMEGVLSAVAFAMTKVYGDKMAQGLRDFATNISIISGLEGQRTRDLQAQAAAWVENSTAVDVATDSESIRYAIMRQEVDLQAVLNENMGRYNSEQQAWISDEQQKINALKNNVLSLSELIENMTKKKATQRQVIQAQVEPKKDWVDKLNTQIKEYNNKASKKDSINLGVKIDQGNYQSVLQQLVSQLEKAAQESAQLEQVNEAFQRLKGITEENREEAIQYINTIRNVKLSADADLSQVQQAFEECRKSASGAENKVQAIVTAIGMLTGGNVQGVKSFVSTTKDLEKATNDASIQVDKLNESTTQLGSRAISGAIPVTHDWATAVVQAGQALSQLSMNLNAINNLFDVVNNKDLSGIEKFTRATTSLGMLIPGALNMVKSLQEGVSILASGGFAAAAAEAQAAGTAVTGFGASISIAMPFVMGLVAAIAAVVTVVSQAIEKHKEYIKAQREEAYAVEEASREQTEANNELIASMREALATYHETGDNKEELDDATKALADAYDLEGAALARLSGKYVDYNKVLKEASEKQQEELLQRQEDIQKAYDASKGELLQTAREGTGYVDRNNQYQLSFFGGLSFEDEQKAVDILGKYSTLGGFSVDADDTEGMIDLYDTMLKIKEEMDSTMTATEIGQSELYQGVSEWLDKMGDIVGKYQDLDKELAAISIQTGETGGITIDEDKISTFQQYDKWIKQVTLALEKAGYEGTELDDIIDRLVSISLNPKVKEFQLIAEAIADAKDEASSGFVDQIEGLFTSGNYDTRVLSSVDWTGIESQEEFQRQYNNLERYQGALDKCTEAEGRYKAAKEALASLSDDGQFTDESLEALSQFDWGNAEQGVISFTEFLRMSTIEQQKYLHDLMDDARQQNIQGMEEEIASLEEEKRREQEIYDERDEARLESGELQAEVYEMLQDAYQQYLDALQSGDGVDKAIERLQSIDLSSIGENLNWRDFVNSKEVRDEVEEAVGDADAYVQKINAAESAVEEFEKQINQKRITVQVWAELEYQDALNDIENSVDGIVSVFNALENGVKRSMNSAGESVWAFSREAANAINDIYPGFLQTAQLLEDGTFALTNDMYNAFFNSTNGIVAANADGLGAILQNEIQLLTAKKENAEQALEIAKQVKDGEVSLHQLTNEQRGILLGAFLDAQQANSGDLLQDNVDLLESEQTNWSTMWEDVSEYSAKAGTNMAQNIAESTASVLTNLEAIRKAAYEAGRQVSVIGSDAFTSTSTSIDVSNVNRNFGGNHIDIGTVDTSGNYFDFIDSLSEQVTGQDYRDILNSPESQELVGKLADELIATYEAQIAIYDQAIDANTNAYSKLLEGINGPVDHFASELEKEQKAANKKSGSSSKEEKVKDPEHIDYLDDKTLEDIEDRYHEINRLIKDQADALKDINDIMDRAYGQNRLNKFKDKLGELEKQADNYVDKLGLAEHFLEIDKDNLKELVGLTDADFGENGEILHYQDVLESLLTDYNSFNAEYKQFLDYYNAQTEEIQQTLKDELELWKEKAEIAQDIFDKQKDALKQYEDTLDEIQDIKDAWEDTMREIEDAKLEEVTYKMEVVLDVKNAYDIVRDFTKAITETFSDNLYHQLNGPQQIGGKGVAELGYEQAMAEVDLYKDYLEEYNGLVDLLDNANQFTDVDAIKDALIELEQNIADSGEAILEWVESIETLLPNAIDDARERFAIFTDQLEHNNTMLETIKELYVLQGQTYKTQQGFDRLQKTAQERMDVALGQAALQQKWSERAKRDLDYAQAQYDALMAEYGGDQVAAESDVRYDTFKANRDALLAEFNEAQEALYDAAREAMQIAQDMYLEQVEKAVYDFGQTVSNGVGLDLLQDKFDHYVETESRYLDKVNEAYETGAWYDKLDQDIAKTTDSYMKQRLKSLRDEIDLRRQNNTLSQYDLDILEAKYNVLQAQMALEDAQNNKTNLRLVRDRQGNWNYQYTADPDDIMEKQQELLEAENEWYNIAKQQVEEVTGEIIDTWTECQEKLREIYSDMTLTDEERSARAQEIYEYYTGRIKYLENEKQIAIQDMNEAGNELLFHEAVAHGKELEDLTGLTGKDIEGIVGATGMDVKDLMTHTWGDIFTMTDQNGQSVLGQIDGLNEELKSKIQDGCDSVNLFDNTFGTDMNNMTKSANDFDTALGKAIENMDKNLGTYEATVDQVADTTGTNLEELDEKVNILSDSTDRCRYEGEMMADTLWNMVDAVMDLSYQYAELARSVMEAVYAMQQLAAASAAQVQRAATMTPNTVEMPSSKSSSSSGGVVDYDVSDLLAQYAYAQGKTVDQLSQDEIDAFARMRGAKVTASGGYYDDKGGNKDIVSQAQKQNDKMWNGTYDPTRDGLVEHTTMSDAANDQNTSPEVRELLKKMGLATGGYTGDFDGGKLAFLHEKELVLNQDDTKNILDAVNAVRAIANIEKTLDGNVSAAMALMGSRLSVSSPGSTATTIEQVVHFDNVEFPNVTDRDEIVEAFNSLVNLAAQRAGLRQ